MKHKDLINFYFMNPWEIEEGFRPQLREYSIGHGRVDIVGTDRDGSLCLVEVKTGSTSLKDESQVRRYRSSFHNLFRILGLNIPVRAIVAYQSQVKDLGQSKGVFGMEGIRIKRISGIPTSRELYGLKPYGNPLKDACSNGASSGRAHTASSSQKGAGTLSNSMQIESSFANPYMDLWFGFIPPSFRDTAHIAQQ